MKRPLHFVLLVAWILGAVTAGVTVRPAPSEPPNHREAHLSPTTSVDLTLDDTQVILTVTVPGEGRRHLGAPVPAFLSAWLCEDPSPRSPSDTPSREDTLVGPFHLFSLPPLP